MVSAARLHRPMTRTNPSLQVLSNRVCTIADLYHIPRPMTALVAWQMSDVLTIALGFGGLIEASLTVARVVSE